MKKLLIILFSMFIISGGVFAQSAVSALPDEKDIADLSMKVVVPENQHINEQNTKTAKVKIEYIPMTDEARIYYTDMYVTYDSGDAMNAVLGCLEDFTKQNKYYHYRYMDRDRERYYKDDRGISWAQYMSHVKFTR